MVSARPRSECSKASQEQGNDNYREVSGKWVEGGRNDIRGSEIPNLESVNVKLGMAAPSRKRGKGTVVVLGGRVDCRCFAANEFEEEKKMKKREVEKMKQEHATKTRQMQKRFLRDIHELLGEAGEGIDLWLKESI